MKRESSAAAAAPDCAKRHFALICARFHADVAELLLDGANRALRDCNVPTDHVSTFDVAGCFELPLMCRNLIRSDRFDAVVALGAVIRGETAHFDYVAGECARGIMDVQLATGTPIGFGILTTDTLAQARNRADRNGGDKGYAAALAAAKMVQELSRLGRM